MRKSKQNQILCPKSTWARRKRLAEDTESVTDLDLIMGCNASGQTLFFFYLSYQIFFFTSDFSIVSLYSFKDATTRTSEVMVDGSV